MPNFTYDKDEILIGPCSIKVDGVDVGATQGGAQLKFGQKVTEIQADQAMGTIKTVRTDESASLSFTLLQSNLVNMRNAMNLPAENLSGSGDLELGSDTSEIDEHVVVINGPGPNGLRRQWTLYRAASTSSVTISVGSKDKEAVIAVDMTCMKDPAQNNRFGFFEDIADA